MPDLPDILLSTLKRLIERRETLSQPDARLLMDGLLETAATNSEPRIAALLGALAARGETTDELAGFVQSLRAHALSIPLAPQERARLVDTCGTGGDLSGTFNISTAAALVAAAAGAWVAKHGNRAVTSACGSADVLEALGIPVDHTPLSAASALRHHRFAFLAAPSLQPALKAMMPVRRALGVRTAFNILGPMANPAGAPAQVMGVFAGHLVPIVAYTLARLETRHAFIVHGSYVGSDGATYGMDELSICGPSTLAEVRGSQVSFSTLTPASVGLAEAPIGTLAGGDAHVNAAILRAIFAGERGPRRDVVVLNAAAVLVTAGLAENLLAGIRLAQDTIDSNRVTEQVNSLVVG